MGDCILKERKCENLESNNIARSFESCCQIYKKFGKDKYKNRVYTTNTFQGHL
jgi:hypothetical protein